MKFLLLLALLLFVTGIRAQTPVQTTAQTWKTYTVIHEKFFVDLPVAPAFDFRKVWLNRIRGDRREVSLGSYADGVVYTVYVVENPSPRESIDDFIKRQLRSRKIWDLSNEQKVTLDGVEGKAITPIDPGYGYVQFFAKGDKLYQFTALGARADDARVSKFFSSLSLAGKKESIEISESFRSPGVPIDPSRRDAAEQTFTPRDVDRRVIVGLKVEPRYTEDARRNQVKGAVILNCLFAADGTITRISVEQSLPHGLTERAIAAARQMRFVPAMKEGRFVSTWIPVEFYFNLY